MSLRWTEDEYRAYLARQNRASVPATDMESGSQHEPERANARQAFSKRVYIHIHSKRGTITDPRGIYDKPVVDGIRKSGLLRDDSAPYVKEISESQESSKIEETIIEIWEAE